MADEIIRQILLQATMEDIIRLVFKFKLVVKFYFPKLKVLLFLLKPHSLLLLDRSLWSHLIKKFMAIFIEFEDILLAKVSLLWSLTLIKLAFIRFLLLNFHFHWVFIARSIIWPISLAVCFEHRFQSFVEPINFAF